MIPKRLIRVWAGRGERTGVYKECEELQNEHFKDWEKLDIIADDCEIASSPFMRGAARQNKTVLLTAVRWYALWRFGGVYMDYDVKPLKDFTPLLNTQMFIGIENEPAYLCEAVVGAVAHCEAISRIMWNFPFGSDALDEIVTYGPTTTSRIIAQMPDAIRSTITIHKKNVFFPFNFGQEYRVFPETYAVHLWRAGWL